MKGNKAPMLGKKQSDYQKKRASEVHKGKKISETTKYKLRIDYNKKNCNPENLITLCNKCHMKTNHNREKWIKFLKQRGEEKFVEML
jgi:5-methylcytosine-specific restriction endonuclease McrA